MIRNSVLHNRILNKTDHANDEFESEFILFIFVVSPVWTNKSCVNEIIPPFWVSNSSRTGVFNEVAIEFWWNIFWIWEHSAASKFGWIKLSTGASLAIPVSSKLEPDSTKK